MVCVFNLSQSLMHNLLQALAEALIHVCINPLQLTCFAHPFLADLLLLRQTTLLLIRQTYGHLLFHS